MCYNEMERRVEEMDRRVKKYFPQLVRTSGIKDVWNHYGPNVSGFWMIRVEDFFGLPDPFERSEHGHMIIYNMKLKEVIETIIRRSQDNPLNKDFLISKLYVEKGYEN